MKKELLILPLSIISNVAFAWEKVVDCNSGALVVDRECVQTSQFPTTTKCRFQIVVRNAGAVQNLKDQAQLNARGELVVEAQPQNGAGNFYGTDRRAIALKLTRSGGGINVEGFRNYRGSNYPTGKNWFYDSCSITPY